MTVLKAKISGSWTEIAGDVFPMSPIPPEFYQTPWTNVTFQNGWAAVTPVQYCKIGNIVYMRGMMSSGGNNTICYTLPVGFRPLTTSTLPLTYLNAGTWYQARFQLSINGDHTVMECPVTSGGILCAYWFFNN